MGASTGKTSINNGEIIIRLFEAAREQDIQAITTAVVGCSHSGPLRLAGKLLFRLCYVVRNTHL